MTDQPAPARHGALFELLRQQVASDSAGRRLAVKRRNGDEAQQISRVLTGALEWLPSVWRPGPSSIRP